MNKLAAYEMILEEHPLWTKEAIFLSPLHAALVMGGPAATGAAGGALGAGEGKRLQGALIGIPAGYAGTVLGLSTGLDPTGIPSAVLGGGGTGYFAGRGLRGEDKVASAVFLRETALPIAVGAGTGSLGAASLADKENRRKAAAMGAGAGIGVGGIAAGGNQLARMLDVRGFKNFEDLGLTALYGMGAGGLTGLASTQRAKDLRDRLLHSLQRDS